VGCALLLAGAVSGMHWTAATGTSYIFIPGAPNSSSAKWTVVVVAVIVSGFKFRGLKIVVLVVCLSYGLWLCGGEASKDEERQGSKSCSCVCYLRP
jgi:NO-binding membrane sensor protein with MHYT domain